jgi:hypothetical protein
VNIFRNEGPSIARILRSCSRGTIDESSFGGLGLRGIREMMADHHVRFFDIEDIDPLVRDIKLLRFRPSDARPVLGGA